MLGFSVYSEEILKGKATIIPVNIYLHVYFQMNTLSKFAFIKPSLDIRLGHTKLPLLYIKYGLIRTMSCASRTSRLKGELA